MDDEFTVNGLLLPSQLIQLIQQGKWKHPGHEVIRRVIPFLHDKVIFLESAKAMGFESTGFLADDPYFSSMNHEFRGSKNMETRDLPWLDMDRAVMIAVNLEIGADVGIALDYRTREDDPRVVASEWLKAEHFWREVTPTFSEFVRQIGIK